MSNVAIRSSGLIKFFEAGLVTSCTYSFKALKASHEFHNVKYSFLAGVVAMLLSSFVQEESSIGPQIRVAASTQFSILFI